MEQGKETRQGETARYQVEHTIPRPRDGNHPRASKGTVLLLNERARHEQGQARTGKARQGAGELKKIVSMTGVHDANPGKLPNELLMALFPRD